MDRYIVNEGLIRGHGSIHGGRHPNCQRLHSVYDAAAAVKEVEEYDINLAEQLATEEEEVEDERSPAEPRYGSEQKKYRLGMIEGHGGTRAHCA
jgi:hypothetical protein